MYKVISEFDDEPSYIVKTTDDDDAPALITVAPGNRLLAELICKILNEEEA